MGQVYAEGGERDRTCIVYVTHNDIMNCGKRFSAVHQRTTYARVSWGDATLHTTFSNQDFATASSRFDKRPPTRKDVRRLHSGRTKPRADQLRNSLARTQPCIFCGAFLLFYRRRYLRRLFICLRERGLYQAQASSSSLETRPRLEFRPFYYATNLPRLSDPFRLSARPCTRFFSARTTSRSWLY